MAAQFTPAAKSFGLTTLNIQRKDAAAPTKVAGELKLNASNQLELHPTAGGPAIAVDHQDLGAALVRGAGAILPPKGFDPSEIDESGHARFVADLGKISEIPVKE